MTPDERQTLRNDLLRRLEAANNADAVEISAQLISLAALELEAKRWEKRLPPETPTTTV